MRGKRSITLILLLTIFAIACFVLRAKSPVLPSEGLGTNITTSTTSIETSVVVMEEEILPVPVLPITTNPSPGPETPRVMPPPSSDCFVGGCSGQICSERADIVSTCEWREEYACYKTAACERQNTGDCGWTMTNELNSCLLSAGTEVRGSEIR